MRSRRSAPAAPVEETARGGAGSGGLLFEPAFVDGSGLGGVRRSRGEGGRRFGGKARGEGNGRFRDLGRSFRRLGGEIGNRTRGDGRHFDMAQLDSPVARDQAGQHRREEEQKFQSRFQVVRSPASAVQVAT